MSKNSHKIAKQPQKYFIEKYFEKQPQNSHKIMLQPNIYLIENHFQKQPFLSNLAIKQPYGNLAKKFFPTKNEPQQQGISYLERERERGQIERARWAGQQAGIFKVRLGLEDSNRGDRQRYREIQRDRETQKQRDRVNNKNPEQSQVAKLVINKLELFLNVIIMCKLKDEDSFF